MVLREKRLHQVFPTKDTSIETKLQKQLESAGIFYRRHEPIIGQPDIYLPDGKVCIFADGCYWHGCHECFGYPNPKLSQWYRDFRVKNDLELEGYKVIRIWEHDIRKKGFDVVKCINR